MLSIVAYMEKMTRLSRAQITRLSTQYGQSGEVRGKRTLRRRSPTVYTPEHIVLLAGVDEAHETLGGPATQKILQRELYDFNDPLLLPIAGISVAQYIVCARPWVPETAGGLPRHTPCRLPPANSDCHDPRVGRDTCGGTLYTGEIGTGWRDCGERHVTDQRSGYPSRAGGLLRQFPSAFYEVSLVHWQ
jgi:hypothetical protein